MTANEKLKGFREEKKIDYFGKSIKICCGNGWRKFVSIHVKFIADIGGQKNFNCWSYSCKC